jgi:anion transporter
VLSPITKPGNWIAAAAVAAGLALLLWPMPDGSDTLPMRAGGLVVATIGLWATHAVPEHLTSLAFMVLVVIFGIDTPAAAFSGFTGGGVWLVFGGIIIGLAVTDTGLGQRIAERALRGIDLSYGRAVAGLMIANVVLMFIVPASIGRVVILMPIALALADHMGFVAGRRGRTGFALAVGVGGTLPSFAILPANLPNIVLFGAAESIYGIVPTYAEYLLWHFPLMGVARAVILGFLVVLLFPDRARKPENNPEPKPMSARERTLLVVLCLTLALWSTDFLHHISPAWIALLSAIVILSPVLKLVPPSVLVDNTNLRPFFYIAGILAVGAIVANSGLGAVIADFLDRTIEFRPDRPFLNYYSLIGISMVFGLAATIPGAPTFLVPLAQDLSAASGQPLMFVLMTQIVGLSAMILPYQAPPIVVAMGLGNIRIGDAIRLLVAIALVTLVILAPLNFLWWRILGLTG